MRWMAATLLALALAARAARADDDAGRLALARQVVEVAHAGDNMRAVMPVMVQQMRMLLKQQGNTDASQVDLYITRFQQKFETEIPGFTDLVAKVYAREFSDADLTDLLAFYRTTAGQHLLAKQPEIAKGMLTVGQQWGQSIAQEVLAEIQKEKAAAPSPKL